MSETFTNTDPRYSQEPPRKLTTPIIEIPLTDDTRSLLRQISHFIPYGRQLEGFPRPVRDIEAFYQPKLPGRPEQLVFQLCPYKTHCTTKTTPQLVIYQEWLGPDTVTLNLEYRVPRALNQHPLEATLTAATWQIILKNQGKKTAVDRHLILQYLFEAHNFRSQKPPTTLDSPDEINQYRKPIQDLIEEFRTVNPDFLSIQTHFSSLLQLFIQEFSTNPVTQPQTNNPDNSNTEENASRNWTFPNRILTALRQIF